MNCFNPEPGVGFCSSASTGRCARRLKLRCCGWQFQLGTDWWTSFVGTCMSTSHSFQLFNSRSLSFFFLRQAHPTHQSTASSIKGFFFSSYHPCSAKWVCQFELFPLGGQKEKGPARNPMPQQVQHLGMMAAGGPAKKKHQLSDKRKGQIRSIRVEWTP